MNCLAVRIGCGVLATMSTGNGYMENIALVDDLASVLAAETR